MNTEYARQWMINHQIRPWNVLDEAVLGALGRIRREDFVPDEFKGLAFADTAIPLPHGQAMLKPVVEGRLLQALNLAADNEVLVVGAGSGYLTACIATLTRHVTAIDRHDELTGYARERLKQAGIHNVECHTADFNDYAPERRFDRILVTGALPAFDERLAEWLRPGGIAVATFGEGSAMRVEAITRGDNTYSREGLFETVIPALQLPAVRDHFRF